jgi:hypothetical protein
MVAMILKDRMKYLGQQVFADEDFSRNQTAIGAVATYLNKWYSSSAEDVGSFIAEAGIKHGETVKRGSKIYPERLVHLTYLPPGTEYTYKLKQNIDQNRWVVETLAGMIIN